MMELTRERESGVKMMYRFNETFPPSVRDILLTENQLQYLVYSSPEDERAAIAGALVLAEITRLPTDAPYQSFLLPVKFDDFLSHSKEYAEIRLVMKAKLNQLQKLESQWSQKDPPASRDPLLSNEIAGWYWRMQGIKRGETFHQGRLRQLQEMNARLAQWVD